MATNLPHQAVEKDAQVWLDDGNVVVVAQNTAFRVHKSLLSRHSDVFRDLFTIPQPPVCGGVVDLYDNCPVVHVSDTSFDFRELLRVIYGGVRSAVVHIYVLDQRLTRPRRVIAVIAILTQTTLPSSPYLRPLLVSVTNTSLTNSSKRLSADSNRRSPPASTYGLVTTASSGPPSPSASRTPSRLSTFSTPSAASKCSPLRSTNAAS